MPPASRHFNGGTTTAALALAAVAWAVPHPLRAQDCDRPRAERIALVAGTVSAGTAAALLVRHDDWWMGPTSGFHVVWDESANRGQDRLLHAAIAYHVSRGARTFWEWTCVGAGAATWLGVATGVLVALPKEIGDGFHRDQGFSAPDVAFTAAGALLPTLHRAVPASRAATLKVNYWPSDELRAPPSVPQLENDYAGQRYYLAIQPGRLPGGGGPWPDWLGVALGHGVPHWILEPPRHRWYVTLDLDARGLPIRGAWWRTLASVIDQFHLPLPGLRIDEGGNVTLGIF